MKGLNQMDMGSILQIRINSLNVYGQFSLPIDKIIFSNDIVIHIQKRGIN